MFVVAWDELDSNLVRNGLVGGEIMMQIESGGGPNSTIEVSFSIKYGGYANGEEGG